MNVIGLFDGFSGGQIALERLNIKVDNYYASEVDKYPMAVTQYHYPNTVQLGDIAKYAEWDLPKIDLILAGFSCQPYSIAGKRKGTVDDRGGPMVDAMLGAIERFQPTNFMLENVKGLLSIEKGNVFKNILVRLNNIGYAIDWKLINSALVSAQNRERIYIVGEKISEEKSFLKDGIIMFDSKIEQPKDKGVVLKDIIESGIACDIVAKYGKKLCKPDIKKGSCLMARDNKGFGNQAQTGVRCIQVGTANLKGHDSVKRVYSKEGKSPCLTTMKGGNREPKIAIGVFRGRYDESQKIKQKLEIRKDNKIVNRCILAGVVSKEGYENTNRIYSSEGKHPTLRAHSGGATQGRAITEDDLTWRKLSVLECERLQTVDDNWTHVPWQKRMMSNSRKYSMLGNGWTIDVVVHILKTIIK